MIIEKLNYKFDIDQIIKCTEQLVDSYGLNQNQLCLTSRPMSKDIYFEGCGSSWFQENNIWKRRFEEKEFTIFHFDNYLKTIYDTIKQDYSLGRVRIVKMDSKKCMSWHQDEEFRIHIPVKTNDGCFLVIENNTYHLQATGECWIFDAKLHHTSFNGGFDPRYHLLFSVLDIK